MEKVVLSKGLTTWVVSYYDRKGVQHIIATFTDGPLQNRLMVATTREVAHAKLLDEITIDASPEEIDKLVQRIPGLPGVVDGVMKG